MDISRMEFIGLQNVANEILALLKRLEKNSDTTESEIERLADMLGELVLFFPEFKDFGPEQVGYIAYRLRSNAFGAWRIEGTPDWSAFKDLEMVAKYLWFLGEAHIGGLTISTRKDNKFDVHLSIPYEKSGLLEEIKDRLYPVIEYLSGKYNPNNKYRLMKQ